LKVLDEEMVPENLDSVTRLAEFVGKKKLGQGTAAKL
jgi:hypothetical protein